MVIGLGRFGGSVAKELMTQGVEVLGVDADEQIVQTMSGSLTHVVRADSTQEEALRQLSVPEFDSAVVGIGTDIEASILTASLLVTFGIGTVWAKAVSAAHGRILAQLGVHHVVYPEHDMGRRVAHLVRGGMLDYIEFEDDFAMVKAIAPEQIAGQSLAAARVRERFRVTVVGIKRPGEEFTHATDETVVRPGDTLIVSGRTRDAEAFSRLARA